MDEDLVLNGDVWAMIHDQIDIESVILDGDDDEHDNEDDGENYWDEDDNDDDGDYDTNSENAQSQSPDQCNIDADEWKCHRERVIGRRLAYLLRYGAVKERLKLYRGGFVDIKDLLRHHLMRHHNEEEIVEEVNKSVSHRGYKRFEMKTEEGRLLIRACYGRKMDRNPYHEESDVLRLMDQCLDKITHNLDYYDLHDFPDEYILSLLLHKLKRQKRLNNRVLRVILCPTIEHLDLENVYLTEATLKIVTNQCPRLKFLSLRNCGFIITDHMLNILLKKLPLLEVINLSGCSHLTDQALKTILKYNTNIRKLNICNLQKLTQSAILEFISKAEKLELLDIYSVGSINDSGRELIAQAARMRKVTLLLEGLSIEDLVPVNPAEVPLQFRMTDG